MEKTLEQRRLDFLEETVAYYAEDPKRRAVETIIGHTTKTRCRYRTEDGRKCAIGRHIPDEKYDPIMEGRSASHEGILCLLPTEISSLGDVFLNRVQGLHDNDECWDIRGLTSGGEEILERLRTWIRDTGEQQPSF